TSNNAPSINERSRGQPLNPESTLRKRGMGIDQNRQVDPILSKERLNLAGILIDIEGINTETLFAIFPLERLKYRQVVATCLTPGSPYLEQDHAAAIFAEIKNLTRRKHR